MDHYPLLLDLSVLEDQLILNQSDLEHLLLLCCQLDLVIRLVLYLHHSLQHLYYQSVPVIRLVPVIQNYQSDLENRTLYYQSVLVIRLVLYLHRSLQHLYFQSVPVILMNLYFR